MATDTSTSSWFQRLRLTLACFDARFPIVLKLALPILVLAVAGTAFVGCAFYRAEASRIRSDFEERAVLATRYIEISITDHGFSEIDEELTAEVQDHIDSLVEAEPSILLMQAYALQDGAPTVIASSAPGRAGAAGDALEDAEEDIRALYATEAVVQEEELAGESALEVSLPVRIEDRPALAVGAYFSTAERDQALAALLRNVIMGAGATLLLLSIVLFAVLRFLIFGRLRRLMAATARMEAGDYEARVEGAVATRSRDELVRLASRFNTMAEAIQTLHRQMQDLANTDELTGLCNRRCIMEALEREILQARRRGQPLAAIMLDVDGLKVVNDRSGHAVGDEALRRVAEALRGAVRGGDVPARFGGDEFLVLLPDCDPDALHRVLERIQRQMNELGSVPLDDGKTIRVTVSAGGALLEEGDTAETLVQRADTALLEAKRAGRNQARVAA